MSDRQRYTDETHRTLPLIEGKTVESIFTTGTFEQGYAHEVTGFTMRFTDGTEITLHADALTDDGLILPVVDVARGRGLYP